MHRIVSLLLFLVPLGARADVIGYGAATRCDRSGFELSAVTKHNEEIALVSSSMEGLRQLKEGPHKLSCRVGKTLVTMSVRVFGGMNGMCQGGGFAHVDTLAVGPVRLVQRADFNWNCPDSVSDMLVKLRVYRSGTALRFERCTAREWSWEQGYVGLTCRHEDIGTTTRQ